MTNRQFLKCSLVVFLAWAGVRAQADIADARYENTIRHAATIITNMMAAADIVGLGIALADGNDIVWARGFGYADREAHVPVTTGTVFRVGSVSKVFSTTAVLKLMEDGALDLDDPVTDYIPEFAFLPRFTDAPPITVRMLLSHQSGLPGDILPAMFTTAPLTGFLEWLVDYLPTDYPAYPPMFISVYCNTGFTLAEGVVRAAAGMPFTDFARAAVLEPLGMHYTSFLKDSPAIADNLAYPYDAGQRIPEEYTSGYATGGMYASMPDLIRYLRMVNADGVLDGQRYLQPATLNEMTTDNSGDCPLNLSSSWLSGLGWDFVRFDDFDYAGPAWIKSGGTMGYTAYIIALPDQDLALAVAISSRYDHLFSLAIEILQWAVLDKSGLHWPTDTFIPPDSPVTNLPQSELDALAGKYIGSGLLHTLSAGPGSLTLTYGADTDNPSIYSNLVPRANGWFSKADSLDRQITVTNTTGETVLLTRTVAGPFFKTHILGQRYTPADIPAAWQNRLNTIYLMDDMHPLDYIRLGTAYFGMQFAVQHGLLQMASSAGAGYLHPHDQQVAFILGLDNRGAAGVQAQAVPGGERLQYGGYHFTAAAAFPSLMPGTAVAAGLADITHNAWYRVPVRPGLHYRAQLTSPDGCAAVICDHNAAAIAWCDTGAAVNWRAAAAGENHIGVYGDGYTAGAYDLLVTVLNHGGHDFDGDGRADPATVQDGILRAYLSDSGYAPFEIDLGRQTGVFLAADCDGDGRADPVLARPDGVWEVWLSGDNYNRHTFDLGTTAGIPLLADVDGDGRADPVLVLNGQWLVWPSTHDYRPQGPFQLDLGPGTPILADFDGDGKADPGMVNGTQWRVRLSGSEYALHTAEFDRAGIPCPGDFDGDGKADPAVFANGWHVWLSGAGYAYSGPHLTDAPGIPVP